MKTPKYQVIVGNIGLVHEGNNKRAAKKIYNIYKKQSKSGYGRAAHEDVALLECDPSEELLLHIGKNIFSD